MKVKVIKDCYYNDEFIKAGRIIDIKGKKLPSWATLADGIETKKAAKEETKEVNPDADIKDEKDDDKKEENEVPDATKEDAEYLEILINEGIEKGILIEDADKKSIKEQIKELEERLVKESK